MRHFALFAVFFAMGVAPVLGQQRQRPGQGQGQGQGQQRQARPGQARGGGGGGGRGGGPGSPGSSTLENAGLKVGMSVPDITIHNDTGKDFPMTSLKGKYTVVVFGCLT